MRLKHAGSMQRFQSRSGHEAGARGAAASTGHPGDMGDVQALRPSSPATPGCRRRAGESGAHGRILPAPAFEDALGQAIKASAPRGASRDVNVTSPATRQLPPLPSLALPHRTGCSQKWQMDACSAGRCSGRQLGGGVCCGRNVGSAAGGSPRLHPAFIPVYRLGFLVALKNVCKFLCSDFPALPLAVTGSSRRARGASRPGGRSPCPAPGLLHAFSPLWPAPPSPAQLRAHWKGKARGGWLLGSLELCRTVLPADACLPPSCQFGSLLPAAPALPVLSICPPCFGPADVGAGRYFPPGISSMAGKGPVDPPALGTMPGQCGGPCVPHWVCRALWGGSPPGLPVLRAFAHV